MSNIKVKPIKSVIEAKKKHNLENLKKKKKSSWGGKRKNSGRKKEDTSVTRREKREIMHKILQECGQNKMTNWEEIIRFMIDKAKKEWKVAAYISDQAIGKAPQNLKVGGDEDNPLNLIVQVYMPDKVNKK